MFRACNFTSCAQPGLLPEVVGPSLWNHPPCPWGQPQETQQSFSEVQLSPAGLAEMIGLIEGGVISGKIGKQILPDLLQVRFVL